VLFNFSTRLAGRGAGSGAAARNLPHVLERWTRFVLRFRYVVLGLWLALVVVGAFAASTLPKQLASSYAVPSSESAQASSALAGGFGERPDGTFTVVFPVRRPPSPHLVAALRARLERAARTLPGGHVASFRAGGSVVYGEIETTETLQESKQLTEPLRRSLRGGSPALVSGEPAVQHDLDPRLAADLRRGEAVAVPLALLVLTVVLGLSPALAIPFVFGAGTIAGTLLLLAGFARVFTITPYAINLVELIGLGLAIDYSLIMTRRYREQLSLGSSRTDAVVETLTTAGRSVVFSGVAVAIGLAVLLFVPLPSVRTMGLAGLLIPLVSIAAALTLQPVLLLLCGHGGRSVAGPGTHWWAALAGAILRRPARVLAAGSAVLLAAAVPALALNVRPASFSGLPPSLEASRALNELQHAFGPGALTPTEIVVDDAGRPTVRAAVERLSNELLHDPEVYVVALGRQAPYVSADGRYARVFVVGRHEFGADASRRLVDRIRHSFVPAAHFPARTDVVTGGAPAQGLDFLARMYAFLPWLLAAVLVLGYVVLALAFRSLVLPLKAVALNLLSVAAAYGLLVLIFRGAAVDAWVPVFLFAVLFGLSTDYEVFLVSRVREARDAGCTTNEAIAHGLERTGGTITAAALVMAVSFAGFIVGSVPGLRQFGVGLVLAVVIDATIVRALLVPAAMALLGRWNWWLPTAAARRRAAVLTGAVVLILVAPATAAASPTVRLAIAHVVQHCHVWRTSTKTLGAAAKLTLKPGTRLVIRADCPMDFDYAQTAGPKLALGNTRTFAGTARVIVFHKIGVYRLRVSNVQTPEDRGLVTLGETNTLTLTVVVR
jgi:putative drug exporter of the RND superfamily